jgi:hypothetical protein
LKVVMHTFSIMASLHCRNFVAVSNWDRVPWECIRVLKPIMVQVCEW